MVVRAQFEPVGAAAGVGAHRVEAVMSAAAVVLVTLVHVPAAMRGAGETRIKLVVTGI